MASDVELHSSIPVYQPGEDWESLVSDADEVLGFDLLKDEAVNRLVGVEFLILHLTFRSGLVRDKKLRAYVSLEIRVAPVLDLHKINQRRASSEMEPLDSLEQLRFEPDSHLVFNDGSTGIYRDIVRYLYLKNFITLAEPVIDGGEYGKSSFDQPPGDWKSILRGEAHKNVSGFVEYSTPTRIRCERGLRLSQYPNEHSPNAVTRYIG